MNESLSVDVQLVDPSGRPLELPGIMVDITLFMEKRLRYRFNLGATDESGKLQFGIGELEQSRRDNSKFAIMDYNTPLTKCDSKAMLSAPTLSELNERRNALLRWFPENREMLRRIERMQEMAVGCGATHVDLDVGGQVTIQCRQV